MDDARRAIEGQLRECYGRVIYTHKTHEKCADILLERLSTLRFWQTALSAVTTSGFILTVVFSLPVVAAIGAVVSTILLCLNVYTKDYDLGAVAEDHRRAANDIWMIRERYLSLITDLLIGQVSLEEARKERDALTSELHLLYTGSPRTNLKAYKRAQAALTASGDMTFSDDEIDAFLPAELKRKR